MPKVPKINVSVIRKSYTQLSAGSPYFIYETGRDAFPGCALRVLRQEIQIGARADRGKAWIKIAVVDPAISADDLEALRYETRKKLRELEDEVEQPTLRNGRNLLMADLWRLYREDYAMRRLPTRSPRTLEHREGLWSCHLVPMFGDLTLSQFANLSPSRLRAIPFEVMRRVQASRPWASGRHTANHVVAALRMVWEFARKQGWIVRDPLTVIDDLDAPAAVNYLEDADLTAIGVALRNLERTAFRFPDSRLHPSIRSLLALRVVLYTGCRHVEELCKGKTSWLRSDYDLPRLEVPRAKGERGRSAGRVIYLGPDALRCLKEIPRPFGCDDLIPGRFPGTQMARLTEPWERLLLEARKLLETEPPNQPSSILAARLIGYEGEARKVIREGSLRLPVKVTRHTIKTIHPRAGIVPDHSRQLLGHEAASLGDRVYLHRHGPSLSRAAAEAENFIRRLLGDLDQGQTETRASSTLD